jgi:radical SAM superfamily enzyme YgiQ (UPF0313 family)
VEFGLESGSEKILKNLKAGNVTVADNWNALRLCKKYGFKTAGSFITGSPGETEEDFMMTRDMVISSDLDLPHVYQIVPFPGTEIWRIAKEKGIVSDDENFDCSQLLTRLFRENTNMGEIPTTRYKGLFEMLYKDAERKRYRLDVLRMFSKLGLKHVKYIFRPRFFAKVTSQYKVALSYFKNSISNPLKMR